MKNETVSVISSIKHTLTSRPLAMMVLAGLALSSLAPVMAAVESNETNPAIGRMPVLPALTLPVGSVAGNGATQPVSDHAKVGVPLTLADMGIDFSAYVLANFSDVDGDKEAGSSYEWLIDNAVVGTAATFTPAIAHGGQLLSVRVTPKTQTGDPDTGSAVTSNTIVVRSALIDSFSPPAPTTLNWTDAKDYCEITLGGGYRLPTQAQLKQLYQEMTIATLAGANNQACERYGWPMFGGLCGGSGSNYWTSEVHSSGIYYDFHMYNGEVPSNGRNGSNRIHVTCVR